MEQGPISWELRAQDSQQEATAMTKTTIGQDDSPNLATTSFCGEVDRHEGHQEQDFPGIVQGKVLLEVLLEGLPYQRSASTRSSSESLHHVFENHGFEEDEGAAATGTDPGMQGDRVVPLPEKTGQLSSDPATSEEPSNPKDDQPVADMQISTDICLSRKDPDLQEERVVPLPEGTRQFSADPTASEEPSIPEDDQSWIDIADTQIFIDPEQEALDLINECLKDRAIRQLCKTKPGVLSELKSSARVPEIRAILKDLLAQVPRVSAKRLYLDFLKMNAMARLTQDLIGTTLEAELYRQSRVDLRSINREAPKHLLNHQTYSKPLIRNKKKSKQVAWDQHLVDYEYWRFQRSNDGTSCVAVLFTFMITLFASCSVFLLFWLNFQHKGGSDERRLYLLN